MFTGMIFWALILVQEPGVLQEVYSTREPCEQQVRQLREQYTPAACIPTTWSDMESALAQLRSLGQVLDDRRN